MTAEERVASLHARMDALRERRERKKTAALGAGCGLLAACLILLIGNIGTGASGGTAGLYSGATMLFENAGGYVLLAVAAFMVGVIVTATLMRSRRKEAGQKDEKQGTERPNRDEKENN